MDNVDQLLKREAALTARLTPTGSRVGIAKIVNSSLFGIAVDKGHVPASLKGKMFTTAEKADTAIKQSLNKIWDEAEKASPKQRNKTKETVFSDGKSES